MSLTDKQKRTIYKNIGKVLRTAREELELSVEEVAAKHGIKGKAIIQYENGSCPKLGGTPLGSLVKYLGSLNKILSINTESYTPQKTYTFTAEELADLLRKKE